MDNYWEIASCVFSIIGIFITGYCFYCFVKPFLLHQKYCSIVGSVYSVIMLILYFIPYEMESMFAYAMGVTAEFMMLYFLDKRNITQKIFLCVTMYLMEWISSGISVIPRSVFFNMVINSDVVIDKIRLQFCFYILIEVFYVLLKFLILWKFVKLIHTAYSNKRENMSYKELILMLCTPLSVLAGYGSFVFFSKVYVTDMNEYIWNVHSEFAWIKVCYQVVSFAAMITTIIIYQNIKNGYRKEKENTILLQQIENMEKHINEVELWYRDVRGLRHDMGNHIMALEHLFLQNEQQETNEYLIQLKAQLKGKLTEIRSGNPISDVVLEQKKREAREKGISFTCDFYYPEETKINAFDMSVILNNSLNNAIECAAECKEAYITISSYRRKNAYMIEISNNFQNTIIMDSENGLPITTKTDQENHGFGLVNIRNVARKYYGDIDVKQEGENFTLSVMLMVR